MTTTKTYSSRKSAMTAAGRAGYKSADVTVSASGYPLRWTCARSESEYDPPPTAIDVTTSETAAAADAMTADEELARLTADANAADEIARREEAAAADAIETRPMLQLADIAGGDYGMVPADEADAAAQALADKFGKPIGICDAPGNVLRAMTPGLTGAIQLNEPADKLRIAAAAAQPTDVRLSIHATRETAYAAAQLLARRMGLTIAIYAGADREPTIVRPAEKAAATETAPRTGGRLTSPGRTDQIFIDLATRPEGANKAEIEAATGWKNSAPVQECARIGKRWGYSWTVDKTVRPAAYHLTKADTAA